MSATPTLLVTGFEPFGGDDIKPSGELARMLHGRRIGVAQVAGAVLPGDKSKPKACRAWQAPERQLMACDRRTINILLSSRRLAIPAQRPW